MKSIPIRIITKLLELPSSTLRLLLPLLGAIRPPPPPLSLLMWIPHLKQQFSSWWAFLLANCQCLLRTEQGAPHRSRIPFPPNILWHPRHPSQSRPLPLERCSHQDLNAFRVCEFTLKFRRVSKSVHSVLPTVYTGRSYYHTCTCIRKH